jgi:hypothetical protein
MQYMILIYGNESVESSLNKEEMDAMMAEYFAYTDAIREAGVMLAGDALHPTSSATTVRVRDGVTSATHGPFAETKEQLGGYYLIECAQLDDAIQWAARCPGARHGSIEVRPVMNM